MVNTQLDEKEFDRAAGRVGYYLSGYYGSLYRKNTPKKEQLPQGHRPMYEGEKYSNAVLVSLQKSDSEKRFIKKDCPQLTAGLIAVITELGRTPEITAAKVAEIMDSVAGYFVQESTHSGYRKDLSMLVNEYYQKDIVKV